MCRSVFALVLLLVACTILAAPAPKSAWERLGEVVVDALRKAKKSGITLEQRLRIDRLLTELAAPAPGPERLRAIRAAAILEQIGGAEARKVLAGLAAGAAGARLTEEAQAALERLKQADRKP